MILGIIGLFVVIYAIYYIFFHSEKYVPPTPEQEKLFQQMERDGVSENDYYSDTPSCVGLPGCD